ncbi:hypothetical protein GCM10010503_37500 [Streptomyces lucensis JCM 4490]|uniref:SDR family NAD(P)-dependent oxidoreductase n=1 Tax=Streptomyces lucensis JCM 4490 TaxID=1306176 RepID=A0A918J9Z4_9ACTN|nr:SDR family NAD(P)-dependent oxidoreductase [Streptomyces lucensis]GGW56781.1 hypothetical protein GCM10010503_37500 [Streptomyces lucensis JCM 4490]
MANDTSHTGSIALITGSTKGIGRRVAGQLAALGMTVLVGVRDRRRGEQATAALRSGGGDAHLVELGVTGPAVAG